VVISKKTITDLFINYLVVFVASWIILFLSALIQNSQKVSKLSVDEILLSEGFYLGTLIFAFFALLLTGVIYVYSRIERVLITNRALLLLTAFLSQLILGLDLAGIIKYESNISLGHPIVDLFVAYLIFVGIVVLVLRLFRRISRKINIVNKNIKSEWPQKGNLTVNNKGTLVTLLGQVVGKTFELYTYQYVSFIASNFIISFSFLLEGHEWIWGIGVILFSGLVGAAISTLYFLILSIPLFLVRKDYLQDRYFALFKVSGVIAVVLNTVLINLFTNSTTLSYILSSLSGLLAFLILVRYKTSRGMQI